MSNQKYFYEQYEKNYNMFKDLNSDEYGVEIIITFYDGRVHHRDFYTFLIDEERILDNTDILTPNEIAEIIYQPYTKLMKD